MNLDPAVSELYDLTGGPVWHMRACVRRPKLWRPFRRSIEAWLDDWNPRSRELLLIGPSAGWCLPEKALCRFSVVHAMDPDPFASFLFRIMHSRVRMGDWIRGDFFAEGSAFLDQHPNAAILFCNMLGQRRYVNRNVASVESELSELKNRLMGRDWASFHDLLSGDGQANMPAFDVAATPDQSDLLSSLDLSGEWLDHLTRDVFSTSMTRRIIPWQFAKGRLHLVEAGIVSA